MLFKWNGAKIVIGIVRECGYWTIQILNGKKKMLTSPKTENETGICTLHNR